MKASRHEREMEQAIRDVLVAEEGIRILEEQLATWSEMREDLKIRSLVSETPQAGADLSNVERQVHALERALGHRREELSELRLNQERLRDAWQPEVPL